MTVLASAMMPRFNRAARLAFASTILCISLLVTACGGSTDGNSANTLSAAPDPGSYTLTASKTGSGTVSSSPSGINCGSACSASYASGTSVTLTASPATGYSFSGWGGACSGTGTSCTVSMTTARSVSATFSANSVSNYTLTVSKTGSGTVTSAPSGINCGTGCSASYASGASVTLTASAASGYSFSGWSGACGGTTATCTVSMTTARNVTATFTQNVVNYSLSVTLSGSGTVSSSPSGINCGSACSASYASGTSVMLTASPATGYSFSGWGGACSGTGTSCTVSMTTARSVSATFSANSVSSATYVLSWDAVNDPNVAGYKIYYATTPFSSNPPVHSIAVGLQTSYELTASTVGVAAGTTVYFGVTSVGGGMESPLSGSVSAVLQ